MTKNTWDLTKFFFAGDEDPGMAKELARVRLKTDEFVARWKPRTDYLSDPKVLVEALDEYELWNRNYGSEGKVGYYLALRLAQDQTSTEMKAKNDKSTDFGIKSLNDIQFFELAISKISQSRQRTFLDYPGLQKYKHVLERWFAEAKYLLSGPEEKILNLKSIPAHSNWIRMTSEFLSKEEELVLTKSGKKEKKGFSTISNLIHDKNKAVRDSAAKALNRILAKHVAVAEHELNAILVDDKSSDELRGITRSDSKRHISDDIDTEVVDAMLDAVISRFDISQEFYAIRAKLFGVKRIEYHERYVEYGTLDKKYS